MEANKHAVTLRANQLSAIFPKFRRDAVGPDSLNETSHVMAIISPCT